MKTVIQKLAKNTAPAKPRSVGERQYQTSHECEKIHKILGPGRKTPECPMHNCLCNQQKKIFLQSKNQKNLCKTT